MVTHQLQVERRTAKERWPDTDVLPLRHADQPLAGVDTVIANSSILMKLYKGLLLTNWQCISLLHFYMFWIVLQNRTCRRTELCIKHGFWDMVSRLIATGRWQVSQKEITGRRRQWGERVGGSTSSWNQLCDGYMIIVIRCTPINKCLVAVALNRRMKKKHQRKKKDWLTIQKWIRGKRRIYS